MAPSGSSHTLLSPAELSYIYSSLAQQPPIRPDLRSPTQFRPLVAEADILPTTNGSARVCFSDGTEAIVGVKAELKKAQKQAPGASAQDEATEDAADDDDPEDDGEGQGAGARGRQQRARGTFSSSWLEVSIDLPGYRDDDNLPVFLGAMITETLLADGAQLREKLHINARWHWKLYIDVLLLSSPLSYPLPLLSLTTHLALLNTALPRLTSEPSDDPIFDDDWAAAVPLYPRASGASSAATCPPVTLLVMTVAENVIFDPSKEELAVADSVLAVSLAPGASSPRSKESQSQSLRLLAIRTVDPPSRLTPPGVPDSANPATAVGAIAAQTASQQQQQQHLYDRGTVWTPPKGGLKRALLPAILKMVLEPGGVGEEVLEGLAAVDT